MRWGRWIRIAFIVSLAFYTSQASAQSVACAFGVADVARPPNPQGEEKVVLSQSTPDTPFLDVSLDILNFDEGTYTDFEAPGGGYTDHMQYVKFKDSYMLLTDLPEGEIDPKWDYFQTTIIYYPGSKTAVELLRYFHKGELELERTGKSPHLQRKEAIARIDPNLIINIAPCRDATKEEIEKAAKLGPSDFDE